MADFKALLDLELNEDRYVALLSKLIGETKHLQNFPDNGLIPEEDRAVNHVKEALKPYLKENGGPLTVEHLAYVPNRGNCIIKYQPEGAKGIVSFVGSHLDVVPANPETWDRNPFELVRDGDKLYGRGTTDCLGHVALVTELFTLLAEKKIKLNTNVVAVFIASEENSSIADVGVDMLMKDGKLDELKDGPVYWVDCADSQPCMGTAAAIMWKLRADGHLFHSGLPHKGINSLELVHEAIAYLQKRFYETFPPHEQEGPYAFATPSTMKPTQTKGAEVSVNQIPPWSELCGDIRMTPFYNIDDVMGTLQKWVKELNDTGFEALTKRGPCSKFVITGPDGKEIRGKLTLTFEGTPFRGIACKLDSDGHKMLVESTKKVLGDAKPYSITGSLPLVGDMQDAGFDVQLCGYGLSSVYHGDNEYCQLSDMTKALKILANILHGFNAKNA